MHCHTSRQHKHGLSCLQPRYAKRFTSPTKEYKKLRKCKRYVKKSKTLKKTEVHINYCCSTATINRFGVQRSAVVIGWHGAPPQGEELEAITTWGQEGLVVGRSVADVGRRTDGAAAARVTPVDGARTSMWHCSN
jgi:hypothetical protein